MVTFCAIGKFFKAIEEQSLHSIYDLTNAGLGLTRRILKLVIEKRVKIANLIAPAEEIFDLLSFCVLNLKKDIAGTFQ